jgi:asparagine synthase (glutamine-hydrolysing)
VPVGILLSGGLDSSLITAMAARAAGKVRTFTVSFPGHGSFDEGPYARMVAEHFGTEHTDLAAGTAPVDLLPSSRASTTSPSPIRRLCRATSSRG